jgi:organic radical activating enzyme
MEVVEAGYKDYDLITFSWHIIDICQYECSYCSSVDFNLNTWSKKSLAWKIVLEKLKRVDIKFDIEFLGGEPTLHPHILEITKELNKIENCMKIELVTNLAKKISYFKKFDIPECDKLLIASSYHPEYKEGFLDKCYEVKKFNINSYINVNLSDEPAEWEYIKYILSKSDELNMGINFLFSTPEWEPNYTEEFFQYFREDIDRISVHWLNLTGTERIYPYTFKGREGVEEYITEESIVRNKLNRFKGFKCKPLMYNIDLYGNILNSCTNRKITLFPKKESLIMEEICPKNNCDCDLMYNFHKVK